MKEARLNVATCHQPLPLVEFNIQPKVVAPACQETNVIELVDSERYQGHFIEDEEWVFIDPPC